MTFADPKALLLLLAIMPLALAGRTRAQAAKHERAVQFFKRKG